jgi:hypothetical protein
LSRHETPLLFPYFTFLTLVYKIIHQILIISFHDAVEFLLWGLDWWILNNDQHISDHIEKEGRET